MADERLQGFLENQNITWKINLSRAPRWGGHFDRLIGIAKKIVYKAIGGGTLSWNELSEVILGIEIQMNRRLLSYVEDDVELPMLTPASFIFQRTNQLPEHKPWREEPTTRKLVKFLQNCKDQL